ncbi:cytochrome c oxidase subunit 4 [Tessaracoccus sp. OS52]|uniref:cytochrome c oxidase subunit 4 n=1 Tax=Tessaracoccus sp. OS52 TaxID=2886691 RepID=UPI001D10F5B2|nr:cytochrome c oxidase subunit 4 [Tessaracoccus sp. OS52]
MRPEKGTFWFVAVFFGVVTPIYWFTAHEIAGTFVLGFTALLGIIIASHLTITARTFDPRPEDRKDAEVIEGAGEFGFFAPSSIWPFWAALVAALIFLGPGTQQWWISLIGLGLGIWAASGWLFQFYRGDYKH